MNINFKQTKISRNGKIFFRYYNSNGRVFIRDTKLAWSDREKYSELLREKVKNFIHLKNEIITHVSIIGYDQEGNEYKATNP